MQVEHGLYLVTFGERLAYAGKILELTFLRCAVCFSTRLSLMRGAQIGTVPEPTVSLRSRARPLRTTSRLPSSSISSTNADTYCSTSASAPRRSSGEHPRARDHPA